MRRLLEIGIPLLVGVATLVLICLGGAFGAAGHDVSEQLSACVGSSGTVNVVTDGTTTCPAGQDYVTWSTEPQTGEEGPTGPQGDRGFPGATGLTGNKGATAYRYPVVYRAVKELESDDDDIIADGNPLQSDGNYYNKVGGAVACASGYEAIGGGGTIWAAWKQVYRPKAGAPLVTKHTDHVGIRDSYPIALTAETRKLIGEGDDPQNYYRSLPGYSNYNDSTTMEGTPHGLDGWRVEGDWFHGPNYELGTPTVYIDVYAWCMKK